MKVHSPEWFDQQILAAQKRVSEWPEWMKQVAVPSRPTTDAEPPIMETRTKPPSE